MPTKKRHIHRTTTKRTSGNTTKETTPVKRKTKSPIKKTTSSKKSPPRTSLPPTPKSSGSQDPRGLTLAGRPAVPPTEIRAFGIDTVQTAVGPMRTEAETEVALELAREEFELVLRTMFRAIEEQGRAWGVGRNSVGLHQAFLAVIEKEGTRQPPPPLPEGSRDGAWGSLGSQQHHFVCRCRFASGRQTAMDVNLRVDQNGKCWLNLRANPTSLMNGHNAYAAAIQGVSPRDELRTLLRLPFAALASLLQAVAPAFAWSRSTRSRVRRLQFRVGNLQVFTYLPLGSKLRGRLLGFVRAVLSVPFGDGAFNYRALADLLDLKVIPDLGPDGEVRTLLIVCHAAGRPAVSINFYAKDAKLQADAAMAGGFGDGLSFVALKDALRLDMTLHNDGLRDLLAEARIGTKAKVTVSAANVVKAMRRLDRGKGKSGKACLPWLLDYAFGRRLPLQRLINFRPAMVKESEAALKAYNPAAVFVFRDWWSGAAGEGGRVGPSVSFVQYAQQHPTARLTRQQARRAREIILAAGIDPDLPADAYNVLFVATHYWDMPTAERNRFSAALEAKDWDVIARLMKRSRKRSKGTVGEVTKQFRHMLDGAGTPAIMVELAKDHERSERPASLSA